MWESSIQKFITLFIVIIPIYRCTLVPEIYSYYGDIEDDNVTVLCRDALENFAQSSSNYTLCTLRNAHPIHMCQRCVDSYVTLLKYHDTILTLEVNGTKCKDKLINKDRLQIVESTFMNMKDLWSRGYCDKCFNWDNGLPTLANETRTFVSYFNKTKDCINSHLNNNDTEEICKSCMEDYLSLNSYYESLKGVSETIGICMDIVDSMNATRSVWSGVLNCCKLKKTPETTFLAITALLTFLPLLFYLSARIYSTEIPRVQVIGQHHFEDIREMPSRRASCDPLIQPEPSTSHDILIHPEPSTSQDNVTCHVKPEPSMSHDILIHPEPSTSLDNVTSHVKPEPSTSHDILIHPEPSTSQDHLTEPGLSKSLDFLTPTDLSTSVDNS